MAAEREREAGTLIKSNGGRWKHGDELGRAIRVRAGRGMIGWLGGVGHATSSRYQLELFKLPALQSYQY